MGYATRSGQRGQNGGNLVFAHHDGDEILWIVQLELVHNRHTRDGPFASEALFQDYPAFSKKNQAFTTCENRDVISRLVQARREKTTEWTTAIDKSFHGIPFCAFPRQMISLYLIDSDPSVKPARIHYSKGVCAQKHSRPDMPDSCSA